MLALKPMRVYNKRLFDNYQQKKQKFILHTKEEFIIIISRINIFLVNFFFFFRIFAINSLCDATL